MYATMRFEITQTLLITISSSRSMYQSVLLLFVIAATSCLIATEEPLLPKSTRILPSDTILLRPESKGTIIAPITVYTWKNQAKFSDDQFEKPIYKNLNARDDGSTNYWNYLVDELLLSRVDVVMLHGRGCYDRMSGDDGPGGMCPRLLRHFVSSARRTQAQDVVKVGMFLDTAAIPHVARVDRLDLSLKKNWKYLWNNNIMLFFDTLPKHMWYLMDGQPVIAFWNLRDAYFVNRQGNASRMLKWIRRKFKNRYGYTPAFILQDDWRQHDTTVNREIATDLHSWLSPVSDNKRSIFFVTRFNKEEWGLVALGFRNPYTLPGCGTECREVTRRGGATLDYAMAQGSPKLTLLEGWTNMFESGGFYRSDDWEYPTQYIDIARKYANPTPATLRFQAEGADDFFDRTPENI
jgi:hypothetical protein